MYKQEIGKEIKQFDTIIIHRHVRPDPDAFGSQAGLAEIIKASFPEKKVKVTGEEDPELLFLTEMDRVEDQDYENALVIVCDTANQARVDDQRFKNGKKLIKIDHHPVVDEYGDIQWVDTNASSTCEMVYSLYLEICQEGFKMNEKAARLLYAGIVGDTGRFLFPSTTKQTLQYAAELVTYSFDRPLLYNQLYKTSIKVAKLKGYILQHFTVHEEGYSTIRLSKETLDKFELTASETSQLVGLLGDIEGILSWVFFVEEEDIIRVRLRSKGPVINEIAAAHNGGGHPMAAGATAYSWEETEEIAEELKKVCKDFQQDL